MVSYETMYIPIPSIGLGRGHIAGNDFASEIQKAISQKSKMGFELFSAISVKEDVPNHYTNGVILIFRAHPV